MAVKFGRTRKGERSLRHLCIVLPSPDHLPSHRHPGCPSNEPEGLKGHAVEYQIGMLKMPGKIFRIKYTGLACIIKRWLDDQGVCVCFSYVCQNTCTIAGILGGLLLS